MDAIKHSNLADKVSRLRTLASIIRRRVIWTSSKAKIPHLGSCLSCIEILTTLYWSELNIDPKDPYNKSRDRFLLSKGHASPVLLQILSERGFFPKEELNGFGKNGSLFHEHPPKSGLIPGIEAATGSLGHGLPMALGMALSSKIADQKFRSYALLSDGECNEGSIWEAALLAAAQKTSQLTAIIDFNKWQATGRSQDIMALDPLAKKWDAFGWHALEVDGHNIGELLNCFELAKQETQKPSVIIAHTIKGKGISFMEDDNNWHYRTPNTEELELALKELS
ncbi:transketolase [Prochlorococcus sp. MIT 1300]|uniref:transketolase n=1 Tax=Prochlorococcus sp. MIT 1300 TaxID=3096218 RepID=UPI002A7602D9|nr:transketolase [Prochlorococcus sp. MIT 1300]